MERSREWSLELSTLDCWKDVRLDWSDASEACELDVVKHGRVKASILEAGDWHDTLLALLADFNIGDTIHD